MSDVPRIAIAALLFISSSLHKSRRLQRSRVAAAHASAPPPAQAEPSSAPVQYEAELSHTGYLNRRILLRSCFALFLLALTLGAYRTHPLFGGAALFLMLPGWYFLPWWRRTGANQAARIRQRTQEGRLVRQQGKAAYLQMLQGSWIKDKVASDSMEPALEMVHLGRLMRSAVRLVKGIRLRVFDECFEMAVFSAIPWFKVIERYPLSGSTVTCKRRDLRRGSHKGKASYTADGELQLSIEWGSPFGGSGTEVYHLIDADTLHVTSTMTVGGRTIEYTNVHKKK